MSLYMQVLCDSLCVFSKHYFDPSGASMYLCVCMCCMTVRIHSVLKDSEKNQRFKRLKKQIRKNCLNLFKSFLLSFSSTSVLHLLQWHPLSCSGYSACQFVTVSFFKWNNCSTASMLACCQYTILDCLGNISDVPWACKSQSTLRTDSDLLWAD